MLKMISLSLLVFLSAAAILSSCSRSHLPELSKNYARPVSAEDFHLTLLHTNDVHAHVLPFDKHGVSCGEEQDEEQCFGGLARVTGLVKRIRSENPGSLLLDAGDQFQGTMFYTYFKGAVIGRLMSEMRYDAMALGNHEFDDGPAVLADFLQQVKFPVLAANLDVSGEPLLSGLLQSEVILERGGRRIGVVGFITESTRYISSPGEGVVISGIEDSLREAVARLEEQGVDIIIGLSHAGLDHDLFLASQLDGLDVIIGGHSHSLLRTGDPEADGPYPIRVESPSGAPVLVVTAYYGAKFLGRLDVEFDEIGRVLRWSGSPLPVTSKLPLDPGAQAIIEESWGRLEPLFKEVIGSAAMDLFKPGEGCRFHECRLGNLIADALLEATRGQGVQIALTNGGGIRADVPKGDITVAQMMEVLPFHNYLATFSLSGADLRLVLEHSVSRAENRRNDGTGRFLQIAGLSFSWDPSRPVGQRVGEIRVQNAQGKWTSLDENESYKIAAPDFLRRGGDDYQVFKQGAIESYDHGRLVTDIVIEHIRRNSPLVSRIEGRILRTAE